MTHDLSSWHPNPRQEAMLAASEQELLFGGAAGGGKSDALVIDALGLQFGAMLFPSFSGVLFRKTFRELTDLERRSRYWYPRAVPGITYNSSDKRWTAPSGATIEFSYCETVADAYRHQGREYQWIGWDELTLWPNPDAYEFLITRLRTTNPKIPLLVRGSCNPGGVGHRWVQDRWRIGPEGGATRFEATPGWWRRFIPARLSDNPYLGDDYRRNLEAQPEMVRRALLEGRWDVLEVPGAIYRVQMEQAQVQGRIRDFSVEPTIPVHTAWDLGVGDATAIWFFQVEPGGAIRLVDYYEASGEGLPHYAKVLQERGYLYGRHWAPHDIAVRELGTGRSRVEAARGLGIQFHVVPQAALEDGIHAARMVLDRCWFRVPAVRAGLDALTNYRWDYNQRMGEFKATPVHDWSSHGADAFRYLAIVAREERDRGGRGRGGRMPAGAGAWMT